MKMQDLIKLLNEANQAYYNSDSPLMSDIEYDLLMQDLKEQEQSTGVIFSNSPTLNVGAPVLSELKKVSIQPKPMLSLDKCHSIDEIARFAGNQKVIAMVKLDGLSVRIKYINGKLESANTRGNGEEGTDITEHIKQFQNVPLSIKYSGEYIIDGEAIIKTKDFEEINKHNDFKNPRNAAAGALNILDTALVKERKLSFIAWDIIFGDSSNSLTERLLNAAHNYGFEIAVPYSVENAEYDKINEQVINSAIDSGYPYDGVVWKYDDIEYGESLGQTSHHFKNGIAWKPKVEMAETTLLGIQWQLGRTGVLTPVARFEPVELDGSVIERASLHNYSVMRKVLGDCAYPGERLKIIKANMIIPQIVEAYPHYNYGEVVAQGGVSAHDELEQCPVCGGEVALRESADGVLNYWCENPGCEGKLINRLDHYCGKKGLDIKGLSKATLTKLVDWEWITNIIDLYNLNSYEKEWNLKEGFGEKSVNNILSAINNSKNNVELSSFISAIGIPLVGQNVAKEICKHVNSYEEFRDLVKNNFKFYEWDTFGPILSDNILNYNYDEADQIAKLLTFKECEKVNDKLKGLNFVITGSLKTFKNRTELKNIIESNGGKVVSTVTSKTNYLINNNIDSTSSKNLSAKKLGIPIISENNFVDEFLTS